MPCCNLLQGVYNKKHEMNKYSAVSADRIFRKRAVLMKKKKEDIKKVVLAYSGGLDTYIIIPWLKEN